MINFSNILSTLFPDIIPVYTQGDDETKNDEIKKDVNETELTVSNDNDSCNVSLNGKTFDLTKKEDYEKAKSLLNDLSENQLMKWIFNEEELDKLISDIGTDIDNMYHQGNPESCNCGCPCVKDELNLEDDGNYIANAYLEDVVENWNEICVEDKKRYMNVISDFYNWLMKKSNCRG